MLMETCSICQKAAPRPVLICEMNIDNPTYYCDTKCRNHGHARLIIYRTGDLLREIFYAFREAAFVVKVTNVEKRDGTLHVYEGDYKQNGRPPYGLDGPLFRFPGEFVPDPQDKERLLSMQACTDGVQCTFEISKILLKGVVTTMEEGDFRSMPGSSSTIKYRCDGSPDTTNYNHSTLIVEAIDGESYVFDIGGAQHGQFKPVLPFSTYITRDATLLVQLHPHGSELQNTTNLGYLTGGPPTIEEKRWIRFTRIQCLVHQRMVAVYAEWEKENKMSLREIVRAPSQAKYEEKKVSLVSRVLRELKAFVAKWEEKGRPFEMVPFLNIVPESRSRNATARCTVEVQGAGSRAYRRCQEDINRKEFRQFQEALKMMGG